MRRLGVLTLAASALLALGGVASAHSPSHSTTIVIDGPLGPPNNETIVGHLTSQKRACIAGRTVKLYTPVGSSNRLVDTDTSSKNGSWSGRGAFANGAFLRVTRKTIGRRHHRQTCKAASASFLE